MKTRFLIIVLILPFFSFVSCGQSRQEKTKVIIGNLKMIENQKANYQFQLEPLKYQATGDDSIRINELEEQLSGDEIIKRINLVFSKLFSDQEINDIYKFIQTSAFEKFFNSGETQKAIASGFKDITKEIEEISQNIREPNKTARKKFEPIPIDREDGFYETSGYSFSTGSNDIELADKPSLTSIHILEVKKVFSSYNDKPEISIIFTKEGARIFHLLTKENIGKPIAIVLSKHIVSMPNVNGAIMGGKASISGDFSEEEIEKMIEILNEK